MTVNASKVSRSPSFSGAGASMARAVEEGAVPTEVHQLPVFSTTHDATLLAAGRFSRSEAVLSELLLSTVEGQHIHRQIQGVLDYRRGLSGDRGWSFWNSARVSAVETKSVSLSTLMIWTIQYD